MLKRRGYQLKRRGRIKRADKIRVMNLRASTQVRPGMAVNPFHFRWKHGKGPSLLPSPQVAL